MIFLKIILAALGLLLAAALLIIIYLYVCTLFVDTGKTYEEESPLYRWNIKLFCFFARVLSRTRLHVSGAEKLPEGRYLLVQNHRSNFDPFLTLEGLRNEHLIFVSKPSNFRIPIIGPTVHRCLFMPIDRENPRNAILTFNRSAELLVADKGSIAIYPEGTRNMTEDLLLPFHNAVFKVAQRANVPIVVTTLWGTDGIRKRFPLHHTDVYLDILEVMPIEEIKGKGTAEIGEHVDALMRGQLEKRMHCKTQK